MKILVERGTWTSPARNTFVKNINYNPRNVEGIVVNIDGVMLPITLQNKLTKLAIKQDNFLDVYVISESGSRGYSYHDLPYGEDTLDKYDIGYLDKVSVTFYDNGRNELEMTCTFVSTEDNEKIERVTGLSDVTCAKYTCIVSGYSKDRWFKDIQNTNEQEILNIISNALS